MKIHSGEKSNKCNQCDYASYQAGDLMRHLKIHSGEKFNKCSQCEFASSRTDKLKTHLKTHSGEKTKKCNHCDFASSQVAIWRDIWKRTAEKSKKLRKLWTAQIHETFENTFFFLIKRTICDNAFFACDLCFKIHFQFNCQASAEQVQPGPKNLIDETRNLP